MKTLIALLGAEIVMIDGAWHSCDLPLRETTLEYPCLRVYAAAALLRRQEEAVVLLQGGLAKGDRPSLAIVMQQELFTRGITKERMILEERSEKTFHQLRELDLFALQNPPNKILILSNDWHLPRVQAMVTSFPELNQLRKLSPDYIAAEDVLIAENPEQWRPSIDRIRLLPIMQTVIAREKKGVEDIRKGTYLSKSVYFHG